MTPLGEIAKALRADPVRELSRGVLLLTILVLVIDGVARRLFTAWASFAIEAIVVTADLARVDTAPTLLVAAAFLAKLGIALAPAAVLFAIEPRWRLACLLFTAPVLVGAFTFVRACPTAIHWALAFLVSALGVGLVRRRFRWAVALPLLVLVLLPAMEHGSSWRDDASLRARCEANDGERPLGVLPAQRAPFYYGIHVLTPEWVLLTGETSEDGRFLGLPHAGSGSWWLRAQPDGTYAIDGPSRVTGNVWTSCTLGRDQWLARASSLVRFRAPIGAEEQLDRFAFSLIGVDAPDVACDAERGLVFVSDLFDGRLVELGARDGAPAHRRSDAIGARGGALESRASDGRLLASDFQYLAVYDPDTHRVLQRVAASSASQSLALCPSDGMVAIPDLAGRLRVFRMNGDGSYAFAWGLALFAPRFASFSPDCAHVAVTSADDVHVSIIERATRRVVRVFEVGPGLRGGAFVGPRAFAIADACTMTVLRF